MVAPFETVLKDSALQENWFRRLVAAVIDWIILGIVYAILAVIVFAGWLITEGVSSGWGPGFRVGNIVGLSAIGMVLWVLGILYFSITESMWGASVGKSLLSMRVVGEDGNRPLFMNAIIRNVSRVHGLLFLLDLIGGLVLEGDPRQRFTDRLAKTVVYHAKSSRGGPYVQQKILNVDEANAAAKGAPPPAEPGAREGPQPAAAQPEAEPAGEVKCPQCGAVAKPGDTFCAKCGAKLGQ